MRVHEPSALSLGRGTQSVTRFLVPRNSSPVSLGLTLWGDLSLVPCRLTVSEIARHRQTSCLPVGPPSPLRRLPLEGALQTQVRAGEAACRTQGCQLAHLPQRIFFN